jgi:hypothetical protein
VHNCVRGEETVLQGTTCNCLCACNRVGTALVSAPGMSWRGRSGGCCNSHHVTDTPGRQSLVRGCSWRAARSVRGDDVAGCFSVFEVIIPVCVTVLC